MNRFIGAGCAVVYVILDTLQPMDVSTAILLATLCICLAMPDSKR